MADQGPGSVAAIAPTLPAREVALAADDERALLALVRGGDERAFAGLVRQHQHRIYELLLRMLGDAGEAEDVAQEVFVSLHRSLPSFRGESRISTWLFRIAKNHCLNRLKALGRRGRGRQLSLEAVDESDGGERRPDRLLEQRERDALVQAAIAELPEDHRLVVILRDIEGLAYEEIAAVLGEPEGTVKSRLHRGRLALARKLTGLRAASEEETP